MRERIAALRGSVDVQSLAGTEATAGAGVGGVAGDAPSGSTGSVPGSSGGARVIVRVPVAS
jgi:hypothetical protein